MFPQFENDPHASFWSLATLAFSEARAANLVDARPSPEHHASLEPDEHLACYDYLYYTSVHQVGISPQERARLTDMFSRMNGKRTTPRNGAKLQRTLGGTHGFRTSQTTICV